MALAGTTAGRIGWVGYGIASAAMVWAATPKPGQAVAAAIAGLWWVALSVPALWRHRSTPVVVTTGGQPDPVQPAVAAPLKPAEQDVPKTSAPLVEFEPRDDAARLGGVYERLTRRRQFQTDLVGPSSSTWEVTAVGQGFHAVDRSGRPVAGLARSVEAVTDLLSALSIPPGSTPQIRWNGAPVGTWIPARLPYDDAGELSLIGDFLKASAQQRVELESALRASRRDWDLGAISEQITARATTLDLTHPLVSVIEFGPHDAWGQGEDPGYIHTFGWVNPRYVIGGNASHWNGFADHRPHVVGLIIAKLLTADDPGTAAFEVLSDQGIVYLEQANGPAGPVYQVTANATHRTHALRILDAPLLAAEIQVSALPLRLQESSLRERGLSHSAESIWRGLMRRGLLKGDIEHSRFGAVLEPHHVAAPWLLRNPSDAAKITAAYKRVYPGAFSDIPTSALRSGSAWVQWLNE